MGKDRDKQRTKGNVKPSSSGRAAALVTRDGAMGFVGFGGQGATTLGYVPLPASQGDEVDSSVDSDFRMVMRKLTKRDAVTKLKAMQEFTELCKKSSSDAIEGVLPYWPRLFNKLAVDTDHRVREATQDAMEQLMFRVGRGLAPHLKSVISIWMSAQFDTYAPVSSAAQRSFQAAFAPEKQKNAIVFCKEVLCEFVKDNLLNQTASTLSDPKYVAEEDRESKYNRTISSSLLVLGHLISTCTDDINMQMIDSYRDIFDQKKFWKLIKHKSIHIRASMFSLIATSCQQIPSLMQSLSAQLCPAVMTSIDDMEPVVSSHLWDAILSVLQSVPDCWEQVNIRKAVLPKLWSLLKNGGSGNASAIFPNLLPFISKLPAQVLVGGFYRELFPSMRTGLSCERVVSSPTQRAVVMTTYMECLRYCLLRSAGAGEEAKFVQDYLIKDEMMSIVIESLEPGSSLPIMQFYTALADLLSFLATSNQSDLVYYKDVFDWFWEELGRRCITLIDGCTTEKSSLQVSNAICTCLTSLKSPSKSQQTTKKAKVMFTDSLNIDEKDNNTNTTKELISSHDNSNVEKLYNGKLLGIACGLCKFCLEVCNSEESEKAICCLRILSVVFPEFISEQLLLILRKNDVTLKGERPFIEFLDSVLYPWIQDSRNKSDAHLQCALDMFYGILRTFSEKEQVEKINSIIKMDETATFLFIVLEKGVSARIAGVHEWLCSEEACFRLNAMLSRLGKLVTEEDWSDERDAIWRILQLCFPSDDTETRVNCTCVDAIFEKFLEMLRPGATIKSNDLDQMLSIMHAYFRSFENYERELSSVTEDVLLALFLLQFGETLASKAHSAWQSGLNALVCRGSGVDMLLVRAAAIISDRVKNANSAASVLSLSTIAGTLLRDILSLSTAENRMLATAKKVLHGFTGKLEQTRIQTQATTTWQAVPILLYHLPITEPIPEIRHTSVVISSSHIKAVSFAVSLVRNIHAGTEGTVDSGSLLDSSVAVEVLLEEMWQFCWSQCVNASEEPCLPLLEWLKSSTDEKRQLLLHTAISRSREQGMIWGLVLSHVLRELEKEAQQSLDKQSLVEPILLSLSDAVAGDQKSPEDAEVQASKDEQAVTTAYSSSCPMWETQTLVSMLSCAEEIYTVKTVTDRALGWIGEKHSTQVYAHALSLLASSLSRWSVLVSSGRTPTVDCDVADVETRRIEYQMTMCDVMNQLMEWRAAHERTLLLNADMSDVTSAEVTANLSIIRVLVLAIQTTADQMSSDHWDFTLCGLTAWLQTCQENLSMLTSSLLWNALAVYTCHLHTTVASFFDENRAKLEELKQSQQGEAEVKAGTDSRDDQASGPIDEKSTGFPPNLIGEWDEFFSGNVFGTVLALFLHVADQTNREAVEATRDCLLRSLGRAVTHTPTRILHEFKFDGAHAPGDEDAMPPWAEALLHRCLALMTSDVIRLQLASYFLLLKVMPDLATLEISKQTTEGEEETGRSPPFQLIATMEAALAHTESLLADAMVKFGEHLSVADDHEAQAALITLTLSSKLLLAFFRHANPESRVEYAHFLRKSAIINKLLRVLFYLMPLDKASVIADDYEVMCDGEVTEGSIQDLARSLYFSLLHWMPAIARQWFNGLEKKHATIVDKYTSNAVTQLLCQREMQQVQSSSNKFDNMQVKTRQSAGEVAAVYTVDEISMELVVKLANNHPLGVVTVESGKKVGVTTAQWRRWMLQMTTFLTHQNGSIMDGLILWKRNADKHFEGVEDCMICFSVIHMSNYSLPKLSCRTCKKKFHSICLYRWFNTSNNSTCPLCRNIF